jgi:ATP-dependent Lon protease
MIVLQRSALMVIMLQRSALMATILLIAAPAHALEESTRRPFYVQGIVGSVGVWADFPETSGVYWHPEFEFGYHFSGRHDGFVLGIRQGFDVGHMAVGETLLRAGYDLAIPLRNGRFEITIAPFATVGLDYFFDGPRTGAHFSLGLDGKLFFYQGLYLLVRFGDELPVLPIRNAVLFPGAVAPVRRRPREVGRAGRGRRQPPSPVIAIFAQRDPSTDDPGKDDLHHVGCAARVLKALKHSSGNYSLILQGLERIGSRVTQTGRTSRPRSRLKSSGLGDDEAEALSMSLRDIAKQVIQLMPELPREAARSSTRSRRQAPSPISSRQPRRPRRREGAAPRDGRRQGAHPQGAQAPHAPARDPQDARAHQLPDQRGDGQKPARVRPPPAAQGHQGGARRGRRRPGRSRRPRGAHREGNLPTEAEQVAKKQLKRLRNMQVGSPSTPSCAPTSTGSSTCRGTPRRPTTWTSARPQGARRGPLRPREGQEAHPRVPRRPQAQEGQEGADPLPHRSARRRQDVARASIARALGRKFHRISLGGVHDEAAIRGHRRTYVGALPGQIIQGMKKAGTINPVFMMDEVDKIGHDFRGDPAAALLEVLDPEQNNTFADHYLEIPYDLSNVMFVATANIADPIPAPLRDRMEILEIPGYTRREKLAIARQHLIPEAARGARHHQGAARHHRQGRRDRHRHYTREAGVRTLERQIASVIRGVAVKIAEGDTTPRKIETRSRCASSSAPQKFTSEVAERTEEPGVATGSRGRAWAARSSSSRRRACTARASSSSPASSATS